MQYHFTDRKDIQNIAIEALQRMKKTQTRAEERAQLVEERYSNIDYGASVFEEYSRDSWENKIKKDLNIYNVFTSVLEGKEISSTEKVQYLLGEVLATVNSIYEHININPEVYGFKNLMLDASDETLTKEAHRIIESFLEKNHYKLDKRERKKIYEERVCDLGRDIVLSEDNKDINGVIEHSYKSVVLEKLLEEINFPKPVYYRIQELMDNKTYGEIFEQDKLVDMWNDFKAKSNTLSRVFAILV